MSHLKVPHRLPEHGGEDRPYLGLQELGRLVVGARVEEREHVRQVARVRDHKVQLQVELSADELKLETVHMTSLCAYLKPKKIWFQSVSLDHSVKTPRTVWCLSKEHRDFLLGA